MGQTRSDRTKTIERCEMDTEKEEYVPASVVEARRGYRDKLYWEEIVLKYEYPVECD